MNVVASPTEKKQHCLDEGWYILSVHYLVYSVFTKCSHYRTWTHEEIS
jgi:hypothetical protein